MATEFVGRHVKRLLFGHFLLRRPAVHPEGAPKECRKTVDLYVCSTKPQRHTANAAPDGSSHRPRARASIPCTAGSYGSSAIFSKPGTAPSPGEPCSRLPGSKIACTWLRPTPTRKSSHCSRPPKR